VKKYSVILADPPWNYHNKSLNKGGAERHYSTMKTEEIAALPVGAMAADDAFLFMWGTWPNLPAALTVIGAWGFHYRTVAFNWVKHSKNGKLMWGMGSYTRSNSEFCLLAVRGKPAVKSRSVHSCLSDVPREHSRKPDRVRDLIVELAGDVPRIELFARTQTPGWDAWGDQVNRFV
jgi:N6-adenosine-specific RNA methylase IME4